MMTDAEKQSVLTHQLLMSESTWEKMIELGYTPEKEISLEFFYESPTWRDAEALRTFLQSEVEYTSVVHAYADEWKLTGRTQQTKLTLSIIKQWIEWMVIAGFQFNSKFDGWGAEIS